MVISCRTVENNDDYKIARHIRTVVFVDEQKVTVEEEFDELDDVSTHILAYLDGEAVATARITFFEDRTKLGRVAVLEEFRGLGVGWAIMVFIIEIAREKGKHPIYGHSQTYAVPFYERLGMKRDGEEFMEARLPHYRMVLE